MTQHSSQLSFRRKLVVCLFVVPIFCYLFRFSDLLRIRLSTGPAALYICSFKSHCSYSHPSRTPTFSWTFSISTVERLPPPQVDVTDRRSAWHFIFYTFFLADLRYCGTQSCGRFPIFGICLKTPQKLYSAMVRNHFFFWFLTCNPLSVRFVFLTNPCTRFRFVVVG